MSLRRFSHSRKPEAVLLRRVLEKLEVLQETIDGMCVEGVLEIGDADLLDENERLRDELAELQSANAGKPQPANESPVERQQQSDLRKHLEAIDNDGRDAYTWQAFHAAMDLLREAESANAGKPQPANEPAEERQQQKPTIVDVLIQEIEQEGKHQS